MKKQEINKMVNLQYTYDAMEILASAFDFCVNHFDIKPQNVIDMFFVSGIFKYYDIRSPRYMSGISGRELVYDVFEIVNYRYKNVDNNYINFNKSKEYWAMYMTTYYKYKTNETFKDIFDFISIDEIIRMYSPFHEASFDRFTYEIDKIRNRKRSSYDIRLWRLSKNLTQKELSELTGINLRTLQKYEINEKDIMKASYETVKALKIALGHEI